MKTDPTGDPIGAADELYRSLVLALDEGIVVHAADGSIVASNPAAERILGLTADQIAGRTSHDPRWRAMKADGSPFPGEEHPAVVALRTGAPCRNVLMGVAQPSGDVRWIRINAQPLLREGEREPHGVVASFLDVTEGRAAEQRLRDSEAYFRSLIDNASDVSAIVDATATLRYASPAAERVLGWNEASMRGTNLLDLVHPQDHELAVEAFFNTAGSSGVREPIELRIRRADGSFAPMEIVANSLLDDPAVAGIVLTARDLTERRRVEEALRTTTSRLRTLIDNLPSGVLVEDSTARVALCSERLTTIFWPRGEAPDLVGLDVDEAARMFSVLCADPAAFLEHVDEMRRLDQRTMGDELALADGRTVERDYLPIIVDGELRERVWVYRDATARKRAEAELAAARDAALEASRAKSEFLAALSHEVRTPMSAIIGMVDLLLQMPLDAGLHELVVAVRGASDSLVDVLNDILDLARIEAGRIEMEEVEFDPREVVEGAAETLAAAARRKGLLLSTGIAAQVPALLIGDPGRLRQVLINLIGNAVKFTDHGEVSVLVRSATQNGRARLFVDVSDTGRGLDPELAHTLFEPFTQARTIASREHGGSGLGLAISRRLVDLMDGMITVVSAVGRGSTFAFDAAFAIAAPPAPPPDSGLPRTVRLVGLPPLTEAALAMTLTSWGIDVVRTHDPADASARCDVALVAESAPDAVARAASAAGRVVTVTTRLGGVSPMSPEVADVVVLPARHDRLLRVLRGESSAPPASHEPSRLPALRGRVLLVEDNAVNRAIAQRMLENIGLTAAAVTSGEDAVHAVATDTPDLVLMDCFMPDVDGYEATRRIRAAEGAGSRVPIVALTASAMPGDREACAAAGMDDYVTKPFTVAQLHAALARWLPAADPAIDDDALAELAEQLGDAALLGSVIATFARELPERLDAVAAAVASGDGERIAAAAHVLSSSSAALSARRLADMCRRVENDARASVDRRPVDVAAIAAEADRVRSALETFRASRLAVTTR